MSDLRKLSEAEWADTPGTPEYIRAATECYSQFRSGSFIPRSEYERVLALLAEARELLINHEARLKSNGLSEFSMTRKANRATLSRIDDALAADAGARG